jgi:type IV pilus assembly protein PilN
VHQLEARQQDYRRMMQQPKDAGILQQSAFLNSLFQRKAFSWTATMQDLETVLPTGVQVLAIDPIVAPDGHVIIRLRVTGERDHALALVRNLEKSRHFAAPRLASESLATTQTNPGMQDVSTANQVNFDILADYRPLPLEPSSEEKPAKDAKGLKKPAVAQPRKSSGAKAQKQPSDVKTQPKPNAPGRTPSDARTQQKSTAVKPQQKPGSATGGRKTP